MSRWRMGTLRGIVLRTAWLFLGAAIGLAAIILAVSLAAVLDPYVPGDSGRCIPSAWRRSCCSGCCPASATSR